MNGFHWLNNDRVILGTVLFVVFLYGGDFLYNRLFRPVIYKPPPGMIYLEQPVRSVSAYRYSYLCEGCIYKR